MIEDALPISVSTG
jgi:hypothetical protein